MTEKRQPTLTFNLKAVVLETGLKPVTLRAWERRYGLPNPDRTTGGHRIYTQRDIDMLKWMVDRQEEGITISRAVEMWRNLEARGTDPLQIDSVLGGEDDDDYDTAVAGQVDATHLTELREAWISALLAFEEETAEQALTQAFSIFPPETVVVELLQKGLKEIGEAWYEGEATIQQEHFASALTMRRLEMLIAATPAPTRAERILVCCAPGDTHTLSPLLITFFLRRNGWDVVYLGANVPAKDLADAITQVKPNLVIFTAQQLSTAATLLEVTTGLQDKDVMQAYGGLVFNHLPALRQRIPAHYLGKTVANVPKNVQRLLAELPSPPPAQTAAASYQNGLHHFQQRRWLIEAQMWDRFADTAYSTNHLSNINADIAHAIIAALKLGDMGLLGDDVEWIEDLLISYRPPTDFLSDYLRAYHKAANAHMDADKGQIVIDWLSRIVDGIA